MKNHIAQIDISTKKGHHQATRWLLSQSRPCPDLTAQGSFLQWRNAGGVIPCRSCEKPELPRSYSAYLLRSDYSPDAHTGSREDFAGFEPALKYDPQTGLRVKTPENPGIITLRGQSLGEVMLELTPGAMFGPRVEIKVRGFAAPTSSERAWINAHIVPGLLSYIEQHADQMHAETLADLRAHVRQRVSNARSQLDDLEKQALSCVEHL